MYTLLKSDISKIFELIEFDFLNKIEHPLTSVYQIKYSMLKNGSEYVPH